MPSRVLCAAAALLTLSACSSSPTAPTAETAGANQVADSTVPALDRAGWTESTYQKLTETINGSTGQGKTVVFDFDNTTQARDISEAILAQVQKANTVDPASLSPAMYPPFTDATGAEVSIAKGVSDYYDAVLDSAGEADPFREYSSLTMPATMLSGRTLSDFLALTATVYDGGAGAADLTSK